MWCLFCRMAQPAFQNCLASMARLRTSYEATIATEAGDSSELHIECRLVLEEVRAACHTLKAVFAEDNITGRCSSSS